MKHSIAIELGIPDFCGCGRCVGKRQLTKDGLQTIEGPVQRNMWASFLPKPVVGGLTRDGVGYKKKDIDQFVCLGLWATSTEGAFMNIVEELKGNYAEAEALWKKYDVKLKSFRSQIKNDVVSLEAASKKTTGAIQRMQASYGDVIQTLTSEEMQTAIQNAERLAVAMKTINEVRPGDLALSIVK